MKRLALAAVGLAANLGGTPYLDRHADDAVRFRPYGEAALADAQRSRRLIFVSVGFFACNGCHAMEVESFENPAIGDLLNQRTVPVLIDRDDRPDLDARFARELRRFGVEVGWPMNLWLLPDGRVVSAATYLTREELRARTERLTDVWAREPERLLAVAGAPASLGDSDGAATTSPPLASAVEGLRRLADAAHAGFDPESGGLRGAPKFPRDLPSTALFTAERAGVAGAAELARRTLEAVLRSQLHDPIDGGFHRYAVDAAWREPHWEKTLDDNALLALDLLAAWRATGRDDFRRASQEALGFLKLRLSLPGGGFAQALDSEAGYYRLPAAERARTRPPARDDSVIVAANAHAARALLRAAWCLGEGELVALAGATLDRLLDALAQGQLPHALREGSGAGTLADHAALGLAVLERFSVLGDRADLETARRIDAEIGRRFAAPDGRWLEFEGDAASELLSDRPVPSGGALAAELMARLRVFDSPTETGRADRARRALAFLAEAIANDPLAHADGLLASLLLEQPIDIVIAVRDRREARPWLEVTALHAPLRAVVLVLSDAERSKLEGATSLAIGKTPKAGRPRGFVCKGSVCDRPAEDLATFRSQLDALR